MSQSSPIVLASGRLTRSGDTLTVELHRLTGSPAFVLLRWPPAPTVCNANPKAVASVAASVVRTLAEAQARLAVRRGWALTT